MDFLAGYPPTCWAPPLLYTGFLPVCAGEELGDGGGPSPCRKIGGNPVFCYVGFKISPVVTGGVCAASQRWGGHSETPDPAAPSLE